MTKYISLFAMTIIFLCPSACIDSVPGFYSVSKNEYPGFMIVNNSKMCLSEFEKNDNMVQPGQTHSIKTNNIDYSYEYQLKSSKEPYFPDEKYYFLLTRQSNVLTVNSSNFGLYGFPWSITKVEDSKDLEMTVKSNCGSEVRILYSNGIYETMKLPATITNTKITAPMQYRFFIKQANNVHECYLHFPYGFEGGKYELNLTVNQNPVTIMNMTNDDGHFYKLSGCEGLEGLDGGSYVNVITSKSNSYPHIPSGYQGRVDIKGVVYDKSEFVEGSAKAYSQHFSYDIQYLKQYYPQTKNDFAILSKSEISKNTEIKIGNFFSDDTFFDVYSDDGSKLVVANTKHAVFKDGKQKTIVLHNKSRSIESLYTHIMPGRLTTIDMGEINNYDSTIVYDSKGLQFFENKDYYLSGLTFKKGNPIRTIDGKMYINPKTFVSEIDGRVIKDDVINLVTSVKLSGSKNLSTISVDKAKLNLTLDGKSKQLDGKIIKIDNEINVPLESFATLLDCKTKLYTNEKSLCVTYGYR